MRRYPYNPFHHEDDLERLFAKQWGDLMEAMEAHKEALRRLEETERGDDFLPPKGTPDFINDRRRLTPAQARALRDESKAVQDVVRNAGITFHRPCPYYVWCDHHGEIHVARHDFYNENIGEAWSDCCLANWRNVFVESLDPEETF